MNKTQTADSGLILSAGKLLALFLSGIFLVALFFQPVETEDIWWHLKAGQFISQNHQVPHQDPFPFDAENTKWVLTQWLGSLFYFLVYQIGGLASLQITRAALFLSIMAIFFFYSLRKIPFSLLLILVFLTAIGLQTRCILRPFVFNLFFIQAFLILLSAYQRDKQRKHLFWIPLLGVLWVNIHLGSFFYGVLLIGIFIISEAVKYFNERKPGPGLNGEKKTTARGIKELSAVLLLYLLTFFLTPYGIDGALHPFRSLFIRNYLHFKDLSLTIGELLPPYHILSPIYFWFFLLTGFALLALAFNKGKNFTHLLLFIFSLFLFLYGRRAVTFFILVCGYVIVETSDHLGFKKKWESSALARNLNAFLLTGFILILSALIMHMVNLRAYYQGRVFNYFSVREIDFSPVEVVKALKRNNITGRIFNDDRYGGYLLWNGYPELRPFVDSRQINYQPFEVYHAALNDPQTNWPAIEHIYQFKIVLLDSSKRSNFKILRYFASHPDWLLASVDGGCVLFLKRGAFPLPEEIIQFEEYLRLQEPNTEKNNQALPQTPLPKKGLWGHIRQFLGPSYYYVSYLNTAITLFDLGYPGAALDHVAKSLRISDDDYSRYILQIMRSNL
ncbi:MAG: hypothetical protein WC552_04340 [Candidatus Omnitrophota bacterium]